MDTRHTSFHARAARHCIGLLFVFCCACATAQQTFSVNTTSDSIDDNVGDGTCHTAAGTCSLRAAVMQANRATGADAIIQLPAGTYTLGIVPIGDDFDSSGDLNFTATTSGTTIRLVGAGAATTRINGAHIDRVVHVEAGRNAVISGVTITGGMIEDADVATGGGGIWNEGQLLLQDMVVSGNSAALGSGILNAVETGPPGMLTMLRTTVTANASAGNPASSAGGGIFSNMMMFINTSTISGNRAGFGGGVVSGGELLISRSTLSSNTAATGAGLFSVESNATLINVTIAGNAATEGGGGIYYATDDATLHAANLYNTTIVDNVADQDASGTGVGSGVYVDPSNGDAFNIYNSLIARNPGPQPGDCNGTILSHAQNLIGNADFCTIVHVSGSWTLLNSLASIGTLGNYGGLSQTVPLLAGSNAIDGGDPVIGCRDPLSTPIPIDQRGYTRPAGPRCDIGAVEFGALNPVDKIFADGFEG